MPSLKQNATLRDYQAYIEELCREKGFDKNSDVQKMLLLTEEVGELAKAVRNKNKLHAGLESEATAVHLNYEEELVDVFNYLLDLANHYNVDLEQAFRRKNEKNLKRSW